MNGMDLIETDLSFRVPVVDVPRLPIWSLMSALSDWAINSPGVKNLNHSRRSAFREDLTSTACVLRAHRGEAENAEVTQRRGDFLTAPDLTGRRAAERPVDPKELGEQHE